MEANDSRALTLHNAVPCRLQQALLRAPPRDPHRTPTGPQSTPTPVVMGVSQGQGRGLSCSPFNPQHLEQGLAHSSCSIKYLVKERVFVLDEAVEV